MANEPHRITENKLCDEDASHNVIIAESKKKVSNKIYTNLASLLGSYDLFRLSHSTRFVIKSEKKKKQEEK